MIQMKNRIWDDITCTIVSSSCRKGKSKYNGTDERSGRLIDRAKLGHVPVAKAKALRETHKEGQLSVCLSKGIEVWIQIKTTFNITYKNRGTENNKDQKCPLDFTIIFFCKKTSDLDSGFWFSPSESPSQTWYVPRSENE